MTHSGLKEKCLRLILWTAIFNIKAPDKAFQNDEMNWSLLLLHCMTSTDS